MTTTAPDDLTDEELDALSDEDRAEYEATAARRNQAGSNREAYLQRKLTRQETETATLRAQLAKRDRADTLTAAFTELGVDTSKGVGKLVAAQFAGGDGDVTAEAVRAAILADPDLAETLNIGPDPRDVAAQEQATNARNLAGARTVSGQITVEEYVSWPLDKRLRFIKNHPDSAAALKEGEPTATPAGWA